MSAAADVRARETGREKTELQKRNSETFIVSLIPSHTSSYTSSSLRTTHTFLATIAVIYTLFTKEANKGLINTLIKS
jgi:hypothetical protein